MFKTLCKDHGHLTSLTIYFAVLKHLVPCAYSNKTAIYSSRQIVAKLFLCVCVCVLRLPVIGMTENPSPHSSQLDTGCLSFTHQ